MIQTSRRSLLTGLVSFLAAPAIVRVSSLMPVRGRPLIVPDEVLQRITRLLLGAQWVRLRSGQMVWLNPVVVDPGEDWVAATVRANADIDRAPQLWWQ